MQHGHAGVQDSHRDAGARITGVSQGGPQDDGGILVPERTGRDRQIQVAEGALDPLGSFQAPVRFGRPSARDSGNADIPASSS